MDDDRGAGDADERGAVSRAAGRPDRARMAERIRLQAEACRLLGSPFYGYLLDRVADDAIDGGPSAAVLAGHERDPGPSGLALRLFGGVHRLVLEGRAPQLAAFFPSAGGVADGPAAWPVLRHLLATQHDELRAGLDQAPQTNEVGRAAALVGGLLHVADRWPGPLRLCEIGASAGLNLRADHFRIDLPGESGRVVGPVDSSVRLGDAWQGQLPPYDAPLEVVERLGCDLAPLDPNDPQDRLTLQSFLWPDQEARHARLRGAFEVAGRVPAVVERCRAVEFVDRLRLEPGTTTVLWHSVMWQYLPPEEQEAVSARIETLGAAATPRQRFAHLALEPRRRTPSAPHEPLVVLRTWPDGGERLLGTASPHGLPTTWE